MLLIYQLKFVILLLEGITVKEDMFMKKYMTFIIALVLLLLCACKHSDALQSNPPETTEPEQTTQSLPPLIPFTHPEGTSQPTTEPVETTQPTKTYDLTVEEWLVEEPEYLSYEEYFAVERDFEVNSSTSWIKGNRKFRFNFSFGEMTVICYETNEEYLVPNGSEYDDYYYAGADGRFAYLFNDNEFLRLDLVTGEAQTLLTVEEFRGVHLCDNTVVYYAAYDGETFTVGRLYLPTQNHDILYQKQGEYYGIALQRVDSSTEPLSWTMMNPDMITVLKTELSDPESVYRSDGQYDYSEYWEAEDVLPDIIHNYPLLYEIQEGSGVRAYLKCTYDIADGSYSEQTGIVDSCWFGSGYPHDHYNTEVTTAPEPEVIMGEWVKIQADADFALCPEEVTDDDVSRDDWDIELVTGVDSYEYLYAKTDGDYQQIVDAPVKAAIDTTECGIYVSEDNRVFAVSYDGTEFVELYKAVGGEISELDYLAGTIILMDGNTLIQLDLQTLQYRQVLRHDNLKYFYLEELSRVDGEKVEKGVYFEIYVGLYVRGYVIDLETGALDSGYRL